MKVYAKPLVIIATTNPKAEGPIISVAVLPSEYKTISDLDMAQVRVENKREMYHLGMKTVYISVKVTVKMFNTWRQSF